MRLFGVVDKVVPYLRFWAFGSVTRCAFSHTAHACVRAHFATPGQCYRMAVLIVAIVAHLGVADEVREQLQNRFDSPGIAQDHVTAMFFLNKALDFAATEHHSQGFTEVHIHSDNAGSAR